MNARAARIVLVAMLGVACTRQAEIYDEPDAQVTEGSPEQEIDIPSVADAGFADEDFEACEQRPEGDCRGVNDFPCAFDQLARAVLDGCFEETGCTADGWVSLSLDESGCADDIGMEIVHDAFVRCVVERLGQVQCPCRGSTFEAFLGAGNDGCDRSEPPPG